ncbi:MAG: toxin-antitoxin system, antitoxin component [bacterium]
MPQISLYVDENTLKNVNKAASLSNVSVSEWVSRKIKYSLKTSWPEGYFSLFGAIKDKSFKKPVKKSFSSDIKREQL